MNIIYTPTGIDIEKYPAIRKYLSAFREKLEARAVKQPWWELQQAQNRLNIWEQAKIVYPDICKEPRFTFDNSGFHLDMNGFIIPTSDKFLLGLLNSSVIWWFLKKTCAVLGDAELGGRLRLKRQYIEIIPIQLASKTITNKIIGLVDYCLDKKQMDCHSDVSSAEQKINLIFYHLYGLSYQSACIIEGNTDWMSKEEYEAFTLIETKAETEVV